MRETTRPIKNAGVMNKEEIVMIDITKVHLIAKKIEIQKQGRVKMCTRGHTGGLTPEMGDRIEEPQTCCGVIEQSCPI